MLCKLLKLSTHGAKGIQPHLKKGLVLLLCTVSLTGCSVRGQNTSAAQNTNDTVSDTLTNDTGSDASSGSSDTPASANDLLESADLYGTVQDFQDGVFQVTAAQVQSDMIQDVAPGVESADDTVTVRYGENCVFQTASINISTEQMTLENAQASDVKQSTYIAVYGQTQSGGEISADQIYIIRME